MICVILSKHLKRLIKTNNSLSTFHTFLFLSLTCTTSLVHPSTVDERQSRKSPFYPTIRSAGHTSPFRRRGAAPADSPAHRIALPGPCWALRRHPAAVVELNEENAIQLVQRVEC